LDRAKLQQQQLIEDITQERALVKEIETRRSNLQKRVLILILWIVLSFGLLLASLLLQYKYFVEIMGYSGLRLSIVIVSVEVIAIILLFTLIGNKLDYIKSQNWFITEMKLKKWIIWVFLGGLLINWLSKMLF
jgi:hypothetical protein